MSVETVAVIGSGLMGRGIAYVAAVGGFRTVVHDVSAPALDRAFAQIRKDLDDGVSVRGNVYGLDPEKPDANWFGKRVKMYSEVISQDREGNDVVAAKFKVQE